MNENKILGIYRIPTQKFNNEESQEKIQERYEDRFSSNQITEGARHGNCSFPMENKDFFDLDI